MRLKNKIILPCLLMLATGFDQVLAQNISPTLNEDISVSAKGDKVVFHFLKKDNYRIYKADDLSSIHWEAPIETPRENFFELEKDSKRPFYAIVNSNTDTTYVSIRKIPFEKVHNFRDIGGIKTKDNRVVNWGQFYRADALAGIQDQEFDLFNELGIKKVFDLRSDHEIVQAKNHLPKGVEDIQFSIFNQVNAEFFKEMAAKFKNGDFSMEDADKILLDANRDFASIYADRFTELMKEIFESEQPLVYHCSAGKDRTGFTTALILSILNVDRNTILDEYEMTNYYIQDSMEQNIEKMAQMAQGDSKLDKEALRSLMGVRRAYLQEAFDTIDKNYGSMDNFIEKQLGISKEARQALILKYTYAI